MKKVQSTPNMPPNIPPTTGAAPAPMKWFSKPWLRKWWPALAGGGVVTIGLLAFFVFRGGAPPRPSAFARENFPLLQQESVQQDLGMSLDQVAQVTLLTQQRQDTREALKDYNREERDRKLNAESHQTEKEIRTILDPQQLARLKQISLQLRGTRAWGDEEVVRTLKLTHDQRVEMATIRDEYDTKRRDLQKVENAKEQQKKADELKTSTNERLLAVLSPTQLEKWQDLVGPPFTGDIRRGGGNNGGGGRGAGNNGGGGRRGGGNNKGAAAKAK